MEAAPQEIGSVETTTVITTTTTTKRLVQAPESIDNPVIIQENKPCSVPQVRMPSLIATKKNGGELTRAEIDGFIAGTVAEKIPMEQVVYYI